MPSTTNQRNRRRPGVSVGTVAVAAAAAYGVYQIGSWAWSKWTEEEEERKSAASPRNHVSTAAPLQTPQQRRQMHFVRKQRVLRCRDDVLSTMTAFAAPLRRLIEDATDISRDKRELKQLRARVRASPGGTKSPEERDQEAELWRRIQESTLTRMVVTVYAHALLFVVLTVQVHLLGGIMFRQATDQQQYCSDAVESQLNSSPSTASNQEMLEQTYHRFVNHSIPLLLDTVRSAVARALESPDWDVSNPASALHMTHEKLQATIDTIRRNVEEEEESNSDLDQVQSLLQLFFVPAIHNATGASNNNANEPQSDAGVGISAKALLDESWDLLESPVVETAVTESLSRVFEMLRDQVWGPLFAQDADRPLAQVIAQLKDSTSGFYGKTPCPYYSLLGSLPSIAEAGDVSFS